MQFFQRRKKSNDSCGFVQLVSTDVLLSTSQAGNLNHLARQFGYSLLNVSPEDIDKLKAAVDSDDSETVEELIGRQRTESNSSLNESESITVEISQEPLFTMAVKEFRSEWVDYFLTQIANKSIPFNTGAQMMKDNIEALWVDYKTSVESILNNDVLGWNICTIQIPLETFEIESNVGITVGTCNSITEWTDESQDWTAYKHWQSMNQKEMDRIQKRTRGRMVSATVKIFCFADICKLGPNGIIRSLLMHKAPASVFRSPLIKAIIDFKWERIWKVRAFIRLGCYLAFLLAVNLTLLGIGLKWFDGFSTATQGLYILLIIILMIVLAVHTLWGEFLQLKRYIKDSQKTFASNSFRGVQHYFSSRQNQIDLALGLSLLVLFTIFFLLNFEIYNNTTLNAMYWILAIDVLLIWAKALYLAQAIKRIGIFVLMIGRVLRECMPYFMLLFGFMAGFGFTMYVALLRYLVDAEERLDCYDSWGHHQNWSSSCIWLFPEGDPRENCHNAQGLLSPSGFYCYRELTSEIEDMEKISESFGTPLKSILTMGYAMVGLFDPEVLFRSGDFSRLVITLFVIYIALQSIVMFNMLIAAMGDAFDGVRAAEEESFLMARAEFIDQYEALLSEKSIRAIEEKIGRYLYVLIPESKQVENSASAWKGRMTTIKDDVKKIVIDSQKIMAQNMDKLTQNINAKTEDMGEMFKLLRGDIKSLEERIKTLEK
eukprot:g3268.t1